MKKGILLLFIALIVALGALVLKKESNRRAVDNAGSIQKDINKSSKTRYQTKTNSEKEVTVEITPVILSDEENVKFSISLDTHSVALDKDLEDISVLIDDKNYEYKPILWSGEIGGHHLEGNLSFPKLQEGTKSVKLVIKEIGDTDRVFAWNF